MPRYSLLRVDPPNIQFLSAEECHELIIASATDEFWHTFIITALNTGMRLGELFALSWDNVSFSTNRIWIKQALWEGQLQSPKSNRHRQVPMTPVLRQQLLTRRDRTGFVFLHPTTGKLLRNEDAWTALRRIRKQANLPHLKWHMMRHTFASHLVLNGVPISVVKELLGHSTIEMTMRYSHLAENSLGNAMALLPDFAHSNPENNGHQCSESDIF